MEKQILRQAFRSRLHRRPFGYAHWKRTKSSLPKWSKQMERWHLWSFHDKDRLDHFAEWVAEAAMQKFRTSASVSMNSDWVDCKPVAWFPSPIAGNRGTTISKCEAGDLLIVVELKKQRGPSSKRAVLLQAKCTQDHKTLDSNSCTYPGTSSTHRQRNLYEVNGQPFTLCTSGSASANRIGGPYHSPLTGGKNNNMKDCARYLLIPLQMSWQGPWTADENRPYQTMWPDTRSVEVGDVMHITELVLAMGSINSPIQGGDVNAQTDWSRLVSDIQDYAKNRTISRFRSTKNTHHATSYLAKLAQMTMNIARSLLPSLSPTLARLTSPILLFAIPPSVHANAPSHPEEMPEGMQVLSVVIELGEEIRHWPKRDDSHTHS